MLAKYCFSHQSVSFAPCSLLYWNACAVSVTVGPEHCVSLLIDRVVLKVC
jgi:hypothetical protein